MLSHSVETVKKKKKKKIMQPLNTEARQDHWTFMVSFVSYTGECFMHTWEEGVFFCIWKECPEDINEIHLI